MGAQSSRITEHVILGPEMQSDFVKIIFEGRSIEAKKDEPIMAALVAAGVAVFRNTLKGVSKADVLRIWALYGLHHDCGWSSRSKDRFNQSTRRNVH